MMAKIMMPETEQSETAGGSKLPIVKIHRNGIDAAAAGTTDGLHLALNVAAMLIAFIGIIALVNLGLSMIHNNLTLAGIFGTLLSPLAWLMGIPWCDAPKFGDLLGTQVMINEFVAYAKLGSYASQMMPRSQILATYALCGFCNLSSIGIQIGGISALVPERRGDLARLGLRAMLAGALATWSTACIAGVLL